MFSVRFCREQQVRNGHSEYLYEMGVVRLACDVNGIHRSVHYYMYNTAPRPARRWWRSSCCCCFVNVHSSGGRPRGNSPKNFESPRSRITITSGLEICGFCCLKERKINWTFPKNDWTDGLCVNRMKIYFGEIAWKGGSRLITSWNDLSIHHIMRWVKEMHWVPIQSSLIIRKYNMAMVQSGECRP